MMEKCDELLHRLHEMGTDAGECLIMLQKTFIGNSKEAVRSCGEKIAAIRENGPELLKLIDRSDRNKAEKDSLKNVLRHLIDICGHLQELTDTLHKKSLENIMFSDRAVTEVGFLSQTLAGLLRSSADLVLVKNPILVRYAMEAESMVEKATIDYATHHEERLIEGLCLPKASPVFLKMLEEFKGIAREAKGIAETMSR